jgi:putative endonuclease
VARWESESRTFYMYIMGSKSGVLYIGVTNNLERRVKEHREGLTPGFTKTYRVRRLLYFEQFDRPADAISREK